MRRINITLSMIVLLLATAACTLVVAPRPEATPTENPTATPTATPVPPTDTPVPTATPIPPTETPTATATATAVPPTATATALSPNGDPTEQIATPTATTSGPQPTPSPTEKPAMAATDTPAPPPPAPAGSAPSVREETITIDTYDYESALVPTNADDPVYPYPRLDHSRVGPPAPKQYRALVLENQYTRLTILPDLGGRIYEWVDKTSGKNLFYKNPVIKPTQWGNRGWWLATGGMEWALPTDEHGLAEASPWDTQTYFDGENAGVVLHNTEARTGLETEIIISLDTDHNYFTLIPRIFNPNADPVSFKFWINGMFTLGAPTLTPGIEFVLPTESVTVHSTGDTTLPQPGEQMSWPVFNGRDFSRYDNWTNYLGVFAAPQAQQNFMGAYNHSTNLGVARVFPANLMPGAKIFGGGDLDPALWTDDGSRYLELWGGLSPTFWDEKTLNPGDWVTWQERWYAVGDMGGFQFANDDAALNLGLTTDSVQVAAISTHRLDGGTLILSNGSTEITRWPVTLSPGMPFRGSFSPGSDVSTADWNLTLVDSSGQPVAALGDAVAVVDVPPSGGITPTPPPQTTPGATPVPAATPTINDGSLVWDSRLDDLGIKLTRAEPQPGQPVYRLVAARFWDEEQSNYLHHVFVEVIDEYGRRMLNVPVTLKWADGEATAITEDKPAPEYAANFPLYDLLGKYSAFVDDESSDIVSGMGLPNHHHVTYLLTFQLQHP